MIIFYIGNMLLDGCGWRETDFGKGKDLCITGNIRKRK